MKINFLINISVYRNGKINRWLQKKFNRKSATPLKPYWNGKGLKLGVEPSPTKRYWVPPPFPLRLVSVVSIGVKEYLPGFSLLNALNNTSLICITVFHHNQQKTSKSDNSHSRLQIKWKKKQE